MTVTVIGVDGRGLSGPARTALADADLVVGSVGNLASAGVDGARTLVLGPLAPAIERLAAAAAPVVLASGDPTFFGIVRSLREAGLPVTVEPAVSSVAAAYAAAGEPWDDAVVVSAHGRDLAPALNACRAFGNVAVLTGPAAGAAAIARGLEGWPRELVVASRLGRPDATVVRAPASEITADPPDPHVVLCLDPSRPSGVRADDQPAAAGTWARAEDDYDHRDSMITKREVRAYVLARLRPRLGVLLWDVGAGSGSVGVEANALGAAVVAVERDDDAIAQIRANADRHGARVRVVHGTAPDALQELPDPNAVFVGGGGPDVLAAVVARRPRTVVAAFAALDRAVAAHATLTDAGYAVDGVQLQASRLAPLPGGSLRLAATNPVLVVTGEAP